MDICAEWTLVATTFFRQILLQSVAHFDKFSFYLCTLVTVTFDFSSHSAFSRFLLNNSVQLVAHCSEACERLAPVLGSMAVGGASETSSSAHCIIGSHSVIQTVQKHNSTRGPQARPQQQLQLFRAGRQQVHDCFQSRGQTQH